MKHAIAYDGQTMMASQTQDVKISQNFRLARTKHGDDGVGTLSRRLQNAENSIVTLSSCTNPTISKDDAQEQDAKEAKILQYALRRPAFAKAKEHLTPKRMLQMQP